MYMHARAGPNLWCHKEHVLEGRQARGGQEAVEEGGLGVLGVGERELRACAVCVCVRERERERQRERERVVGDRVGERELRACGVFVCVCV